MAKGLLFCRQLLSSVGAFRIIPFDTFKKKKKASAYISKSKLTFKEAGKTIYSLVRSGSHKFGGCLHK